jgi:hypothetical protein
MKSFASFAMVCAVAALGCGGKGGDKGTTPVAPAPQIKLTPGDQLTFTPLDPNAGDKGPQISVLFGDITQKGPIGFLLKAPPGFKPGVHTHSSDDYAVGITGVLHNYGAGDAEGPGVGAGGIWFQPGNVPHDNHCEDGADCVAFVFLPNGFDFQPFPAGQASPPTGGIQVTAAADVVYKPLDPNIGDKGPQLAVLFGNPQEKAPIGFLLKLPAGFKPGPHTHTSDDWAVIVRGTMHNFAPGDEGVGLGPGGTWFQPGNQVHDNHCEDGAECLLFVYMPNGFDFVPAAAAQ